MKKAEILEKIKSNVVKITKDLTSRDIGGGITQYSVEVLITVEGGSQINTQDFYVLDEGLDTESATFMNGREVKNFELQEPSRQKKLKHTLRALQASGPVKGVDLSKLEIPFALLEVSGIKVFVAELDGELIQLQAV